MNSQAKFTWNVNFEATVASYFGDKVHRVKNEWTNDFEGPDNLSWPWGTQILGFGACQVLKYVTIYPG